MRTEVEQQSCFAAEFSGVFRNSHIRPMTGSVVHTCNPSPWEAAAGGFCRKTEVHPNGLIQPEQTESAWKRDNLGSIVFLYDPHQITRHNALDFETA